MALDRATYFGRLGIDVWVRRQAGEARPRRAVARAHDEAPVRQAPAPEPPSVPRVRARAPAPAYEAYEDSGPRSATTEAYEDSRPRGNITVAPADQPTARAAAESDLPSEPFRVRCFHYGRVFVAVAEDAWPRRRYLLDVAHALNGFAVAERRDVLFDWPQPGAAVSGGARAFRAFFGHRTRAAERTLLSGARVLALLELAEPEQTALVDDHVYVLPEAPDPKAKQALWRLIRELG